MSLQNVEFFDRELLIESSTYIKSENDHGEQKDWEKTKVVEENNNDIETLTKEFAEMGNITNKCNANRRLSNDSGDFHVPKESKTSKNIYLEEVYEEIKEESEKAQEMSAQSSFDYVDDFEEDSEAIDDNKEKPPQSEITTKVHVDPRPQNTDSTGGKTERSCTKCKIIQRHDFEKEVSQSILDKESSTRSQSRSSFCSGSTIRRQRKINMSFSNERSMEIERENSILLRKILRSRGSNRGSDRGTSASSVPPARTSSGAITRKKAQDKVQQENLILLRKIQKAKPSSVSIRR